MESILIITFYFLVALFVSIAVKHIIKEIENRNNRYRNVPGPNLSMKNINDILRKDRKFTINYNKHKREFRKKFHKLGLPNIEWFIRYSAYSLLATNRLNKNKYFLQDKAFTDDIMRIQEYMDN